MSTVLERVQQRWAPQTPRAKAVIGSLGIIGFYLFVTIVTTWPAITCLSNCFAGYPSGDQPIPTWGFWYGKEALLKRQNLASLATLNYPHGYFSPLRLAMLVIPVMMFPLELLFSPVVVYNFAFLLSFVLTGYTGFLLCNDLTRDWRSALLGGLILMLFPLRVAHALAGHIEIACLFFPVVYVMLLRRLVLRPSYRLAVFTGLALALASLSFVTTLPYFLLPWTIIYLGGQILSKHEQFKYLSTWLALGLAGLVALLITLPFFLPLIRSALQPGSEMFAYGLSSYSADLLSYVSPPPGNPILDKLGLIPVFARNAQELQETTAYLGLVPVVLSVIAVVGWGRESRMWLTAAFVAMIFALGPLLRVAGKQITLGPGNNLVYMPYIALTLVPVFSIGREPGRLNLITGMALSVLAAQGMTILLRRQQGWRSIVILVAATASITSEYLISWPIQMSREGLFPHTVEVLSKELPTGGVVNVPLHNYWVKIWGPYYQIEHGWPVFDSSFARDIPDIPGKLEMLDWITTTGVEGDDIIPMMQPATAHAFLAQEGAAYVLVHRNYTEDLSSVQSHLSAILGDPVASDPTTLLFRVGASARADGTLYALGWPGWDPIEYWNSQPARWLTGDSDLIIYSPRDVAGDLSFRALSGDHPRHLTIRIPNGESRTLVIAKYANYSIADVALRVGYNVMHFDVEESCWNINISPPCVRAQSVAGFAPSNDCSLPTQNQHCVHILFQDIRFELTPE